MVDKCQFTSELASGTYGSSGKQLTYITRCFYNSNYDKHMLKSLSAQRRQKLSSLKVMVKSRQWIHVSKHPRDEKCKNVHKTVSNNTNTVVSTQHDEIVCGQMNTDNSQFRSQTIVSDENIAPRVCLWIEIRRYKNTIRTIRIVNSLNRESISASKLPIQKHSFTSSCNKKDFIVW